MRLSNSSYKFPVLNLEKPVHFPAGSAITLCEDGIERRGIVKTAMTISSVDEARNLWNVL